MTIDTLKQSALDHLRDCSAASFAEPLEGGLWLFVGTKEAIAELVGERVAVPGAVQHSTVMQLSELMRGLEMPPTCATASPALLYEIGKVIVEQARGAATPPQQATPASPSEIKHDLKILPAYFADVHHGVKTFEIRKDDRDFCVGDLVALNEFDQFTQKPTGRSIVRRITYIIRDPAFCKEGFCVMSIEPTTQTASTIAAAQPDVNSELLESLQALVTFDTYETEYDGRMVTLCPDCGVQDGGNHSASCAFAKASHVIRAALATRGATPPQAKEEE